MSTAKKPTDNTSLQESVKEEVAAKKKGHNLTASEYEAEHVKPGDNARFLQQAFQSFQLANPL